MGVAGNLHKQIKRHLIGRHQHFFAVVAPGLEAVCARELAALSDTVTVTSVAPAGVDFNGRLDDLYRAHLHLRTAGRLLMRVARFKATNFRQLMRHMGTVAWDRYLSPGAVPACKAAAHASRLYHTQALAERVGQAVSAFWQGRGIDPQADPEQTLFVRMADDVATLSLDGTGPNLYLRGLKTHGGDAPLRETTAAAILQLAGYDPGRPLIDPMCGSGTFALEAAMMAKQVPPGMFRRFACMQWPAFRPRRWDHMKAAAERQIRRLETPLIFASDLEESACQQLADCVRRHGLEDAVRVRPADFFQEAAPRVPDPRAGPGLVVLNPPWGRRLVPGEELAVFYHRLGERLVQAYRGWRTALIVPDPSLVEAMPPGLDATHLMHGGMALTLLTGRIA